MLIALKALYKDNADTIIGNMDSRIFLGGAEPTTLKELNQSLGKETIDTFNTGENRGREVSHSLNYISNHFGFCSLLSNTGTIHILFCQFR